MIPNNKRPRAEETPHSDLVLKPMPYIMQPYERDGDSLSRPCELGNRFRYDLGRQQRYQVGEYSPRGEPAGQEAREQEQAYQQQGRQQSREK